MVSEDMKCALLFQSLFNPLMLTAAKSSDNFDQILQAKAKLGEYLKEKILFRTLQTTLLQIFSRIFLYLIIIVKLVR